MDEFTFNPTLEIVVMQYIANYIKRFPFATLSDIEQYTLGEKFPYPWAMDVPYIQKRTAELMLQPPKGYRRRKPLPN